MKVLREEQIREGIYDLAALVDIDVNDLKEEYQKTVESISGKTPLFIGDDRSQVQTMALEKMYKAYKKMRQWMKFLSAQTSEEAEVTEVVTAEEE